MGFGFGFWVLLFRTSVFDFQLSAFFFLSFGSWLSAFVFRLAVFGSVFLFLVLRFRLSAAASQPPASQAGMQAASQPASQPANRRIIIGRAAAGAGGAGLHC